MTLRHFVCSILLCFKRKRDLSSRLSPVFFVFLLSFSVTLLDVDSIIIFYVCSTCFKLEKDLQMSEMYESTCS